MTKARPPITAAREYLQTEAGGALVLLAATLAALIWANSPLSASYESLWRQHLPVDLPALHLDLSLRDWVNEGLMTLFFFVVGLEIKRELAIGELRDPRKALLPLLAALGGMALPAAIYLVLVGSGEGASGWAIPVATDIAFAVGVLALVSRRLPAALRGFLLTLAVVDDIGAILVIALFYSSDLLPVWLLGALLALGSAFLLRLARLSHPFWYVPVGILVWVLLHESGIHSTLAGVALGLLTPARPVGGRPVLRQVEHALHPWTSYAIVPLFALANAGVSLSLGGLGEAFSQRLTWAVVLGLLVGKSVGVAGTAYLASAAGLTRWPKGVGLEHLIGVGGLAGIGFTVSLFVASLAFEEGSDLLNQAKLGILAGSLASALAGVAVLLHARRPRGRPRPRRGTWRRRSPSGREESPAGRES